MNEPGGQHLGSWGRVYDVLRPSDEARSAQLDAMVRADLAKKEKKADRCWANNCLLKGTRGNGLCDTHFDRDARGEDVTVPRPAASGTVHRQRERARS